MATIKEALAKLDVTNDAHWTADGQPTIATLKFLTGNQSLTREDITKAAPNFSRANTTLDAAIDAGAGATGASDTATDTGTIAAPVGAVQGTSTETAQTGGADGQVHTEGTESSDGDGTTTEKADLEAQLLAAQNRVAEIERALVQGTRMRDEANSEVDRLAKLVAGVSGTETSDSAIRAYLDSETRQREARGKLHAQLSESGIDMVALNALTKGSPLDASMQKRTERGGARPVVPVVSM